QYKCNDFSKYKLLNTFSPQQLGQSCGFYQCPAEHWLKLVGPDLCLDSVDWPCADHMHSPKNKKNLSSNTHQSEPEQSDSKPLFYQEIFREQ
ncbi:unnamed protein product, partial [Staurois parvus]